MPIKAQAVAVANPMLAGAGLGHDAPFAHVAGDEDLAEGIVDFVRTGVVEVFALEVEFAPVFFRSSGGRDTTDWGDRRNRATRCETLAGMRDFR